MLLVNVCYYVTPFVRPSIKLVDTKIWNAHKHNNFICLLSVTTAEFWRLLCLRTFLTFYASRGLSTTTELLVTLVLSCVQFLSFSFSGILFSFPLALRGWRMTVMAGEGRDRMLHIHCAELRIISFAFVTLRVLFLNLFDFISCIL